MLLIHTITGPCIELTQREVNLLKSLVLCRSLQQQGLKAQEAYLLLDKLRRATNEILPSVSSDKTNAGTCKDRLSPRERKGPVHFDVV